MSPGQVAAAATAGALALAVLLVAGVACAAAWWLRRGVRACTCGARLHGRVALVTGANAGIGREIARGLAERGARVLLACRDPGRAQAALRGLRAELGPAADLDVVPLDLADLASVRRCAERVAAAERRLDILVNNAGVYALGNKLTGDGIVTEMQVNHFAPFLLTLLLLPAIRAAEDGRVIFMSSLMHHLGTAAHPERLNEPGRYGDVRTYSNGKLCNVATAAELARRGVSAHSVHPGIVRTELTGALRLTRPVFALWARVCRRSAREAAQTALHCACAPPPIAPPGTYWADCRPARAAARALRPPYAAALWEYSARLVRYSPEDALRIQQLIQYEYTDVKL